MIEGKASRTAVLVCQARAVADGRLGQERFADPVAIALLREDEREPVRWVRSGAKPSAWRSRLQYRMLESSALIMVSRTVLIDDAVREQDNPQLVILGAGLDGRAWRMGELAAVDVYEVDHPASQAEKRERAKELAATAKSLHYVPVDFARDDLGEALAAAGHDTSRPTTWIWEGVVMYLHPPQIDATLAVVAQRSVPGSRIVITYVKRSAAVASERQLMRLSPMMRDEPHVNAWSPEQAREVLAGHEFQVTRDHDQLQAARELAVDCTRTPARGRVVIADYHR